jgi:hypothetical protein
MLNPIESLGLSEFEVTSQTHECNMILPDLSGNLGKHRLNPESF